MISGRNFTWLILLDAAKLHLSGLQQSLQQNSMISIMQECVDAITTHQRLLALMRGEWARGLLPHSNVRDDYMVKRIRGMQSLIPYTLCL